jgi:hypothetical protein
MTRAPKLTSRSPILHPVYDFGLSDEEVEALRALRPPTESELAAMIVDEGELKRFGRWGGRAAPRRWAPR